MLEFTGRIYRKWINVFLWAGMVIWSLLGFMSASLLYQGGRISWVFDTLFEDPIVAILGFICGAVIGFILTVFTGGVIANFLNMVDNIKKIAEKLG